MKNDPGFIVTWHQNLNTPSTCCFLCLYFLFFNMHKWKMVREAFTKVSEGSVWKKCISCNKALRVHYEKMERWILCCNEEPRLVEMPDCSVLTKENFTHRIDMIQMRGHCAVVGRAGEMELQKIMGAQMISSTVPDASHRSEGFGVLPTGLPPLFVLVLAIFFFSFGVGTWVMCGCTLEVHNLILYGLTVKRLYWVSERSLEIAFWTALRLL